MTTAPQKQPVPEVPAPIRRDGLPIQPTILLLILTLLASVHIGLGLCALVGALPAYPSDTTVEIISLVLMILLTVYLFRVCRTARFVPILMAFGAFLVSQIVTMFLPEEVIVAPSVLVCAGFVISVGALLLSTAPPQWLTVLPLLPLVAYAATAGLTLQPMLALACLLPLPAAVALAYGTRASADPEKPEGPSLVGVICATSLALGISAVAVAALLSYRAAGSLSLASLGQQLEDLRVRFAQELVNAIQQIRDMLPSDATTGVLPSEADALNATNALFNLLPALVVVFCNITAALTQAAYHAGLRSFGYGDCVKGRVRIFRMSLVSAVVYLLAWLVTLITTAVRADTSTLAGTVSQNISLILTPGLAFGGFLRLMNHTRRNGCLPFLLLAMLPLLFLSGGGLGLLAAYEAIAALIGAFLKKSLAGSHGSGDDTDGHDHPGGRPPFDR